MLEPDKTCDYDLYIRPHYKVGMKIAFLSRYCGFLLFPYSHLCYYVIQTLVQSYQRCLVHWSIKEGFIWLLFLPLISKFEILRESKLHLVSNITMVVMLLIWICNFWIVWFFLAHVHITTLNGSNNKGAGNIMDISDYLCCVNVYLLHPIRDDPE